MSQMQTQINAVKRLQWAAFMAGDYETEAILRTEILPAMVELEKTARVAEFRKLATPAICYLQHLLKQFDQGI